MTFEQRLYDTRTRRRTTYTILLQSRTKFIVVDKLSCCFHSSKQCSFGIVFRRSSLLFSKCRLMRTALALSESRQRALLILLLSIFFIHHLRLCIFIIHLAPSWLKNLLTANLKAHILYTSHNGSGREFAVGVEHGYKTACNEVVDILFNIGKSTCWHSCRNDSMVVGDFRSIENLFALW